MILLVPPLPTTARMTIKAPPGDHDRDSGMTMAVMLMSSVSASASATVDDWHQVAGGRVNGGE